MQRDIEEEYTNCWNPIGPRNTFEGFDYAVQAWAGGFQTPMFQSNILDCDIKNCRVGVSSHFQSLLHLWSAQMSWDSASNTLLDKSDSLIIGFNTDSSFFTFSDSEIKCNNTDFTYIGARIINSTMDTLRPGSYLSRVSSVSFRLHEDIKDLTTYPAPFDYVGTQLQGDNDSLYLNCNSYTDFILDWDLHGNYPTQEGSPGALLATGNSFSTPCDTSKSSGSVYANIHNAGDALEYYYHNSGPQPTNCWTGHNINFNPVGTYQYDCNDSITTIRNVYCPAEQPGGGGGRGVPFVENKTEFYKALEQLDRDDLTAFSSTRKKVSLCEQKVLDYFLENKKLGGYSLDIKPSVKTKLDNLPKHCRTKALEFLAPIKTGYVSRVFEDPSRSIAPIQIDVKVFPNPTRDRLNVVFSSDPTISLIQIINLEGKILLDQKTDDTKSTLDISALPQGTYFVKVITSGKVWKKRIIKI